MISSRNKIQGFTLVELLVSLTVISLLVVSVLPMMDQAMRFNQRLETERNMKALAQALHAAYAQNAWLVDIAATPQFDTPLGTITDGPARLEDFAYVLQLSGLSSDVLLDGFNRPFEIRISQAQEQFYDGVMVPYRNIAIISNMGGDITAAGQVLDSSTNWDPAAGTLQLSGYDTGEVVSGLGIQMRLMDIARGRLDLASKLYQEYYRARFLDSPSRDISVDFFTFKQSGGDPFFDSRQGNVARVGPSCEAAVDGLAAASQLNFSEALGISPSDLTNPWRDPTFPEMLVANCGSGPAAIRSPDAPNPGQQFPPYTARVGFLLPNGDFYTRTVMSGI